MWGPEDRPSAISLTFDHLGEAAAIEQNRWPADEPIGRHFSVTRVVPRLLEFLGGLGLHATFFVEGWHCEVYPEALRSSRRRSCRGFLNSNGSWAAHVRRCCGSSMKLTTESTMNGVARFAK